MPRVLAIGDIHGCCKSLLTLLDVVAQKPDDTLVTLGDYIDRGPDSAAMLSAWIPVLIAPRKVVG